LNDILVSSSSPGQTILFDSRLQSLPCWLAISPKLLNNEGKKLGLEDQLEVRKFNGRVHMKSAMIDDKLVFVGSQNFHYSSIVGGGVSEFVIATDSPQALAIYKDMFEYYWEQAIPMDEWQILGH
jgi:phosphatidylserine/phosphatidylglycerophosphate/cardiolipin synthase-like enzyme